MIITLKWCLILNNFEGKSKPPNPTIPFVQKNVHTYTQPYYSEN